MFTMSLDESTNDFDKVTSDLSISCSIFRNKLDIEFRASRLKVSGYTRAHGRVRSLEGDLYKLPLTLF